MKKYILAIDQGTTSTTAILVDTKNYQVIDKVGIEFKQIYPTPGWVEHDLDEIWKTVKMSIQKVLVKNNIKANQITSIGITNQRETICAFNYDGQPLHNAIVWQDRRTHQFCKDNAEKYKGFRKKTGLPLDPYFSATKMNWLLNNCERVQEAQGKSDLKFGTIDTFLLYRLTGRKKFSTDITNASRTLLMDLKTGKWDIELLELFKIDSKTIPEIKESFGSFGVTSGLDFLPDDIPINCILGDQQAALFGQLGHKAGDFKCTYGTGAFALLNTGKTITFSDQGLLTTVAFKYNGEITYALEGSSYIAGAAVGYLRDNLEFISKSSDVEKLALEVENIDEMKNVLFLPFFTGLGSPYWISEATGAILGLTRDTTKKHIALACLEGIALSINELVQAFEKDSPIKEIKVDGGASSNNLLIQIQSNILNRKILRPKEIETTGYGAALGAAVGYGSLSFEDLLAFWEIDKTFAPEEELTYFNQKEQLWKKAIKNLYLE